MKGKGVDVFGIKYSTQPLRIAQTFTTRVRVAKSRALYQVAGLVRTSAKRSMRLRRGASTPTFPPHAHTRAGLRAIEFVVDEAAGAAIVGPIKFSGSNFFNEPVTYIHEFGGTFLSRKGYWRYPERSYMYYTLKKLVASGKIPQEFTLAMGRVLG